MVIYIIEDDALMAECIRRAIEGVRKSKVSSVHVRVFPDAVSAMEAINEQVPDMIFLDVLLTGPDGFTFLNELVSYEDTAKIPVVIVTSLDMGGRDLSEYGVVKILNKATMTPEGIRECIRM